MPTILATSGGLRRGSRAMFEFAPLLLHAVELSGVAGRAPRVCHVGTASGDQQWFNALFSEAGQAAGMTVTHLNLFPMPSAAHLLSGSTPKAWMATEGSLSMYGVNRRAGERSMFLVAAMPMAVLPEVAADLHLI